eukprot:6184460-Pleurochrysis_carterae.AAC.7
MRGRDARAASRIGDMSGETADSAGQTAADRLCGLVGKLLGMEPFWRPCWPSPESRERGLIAGS